MLAFPYRRGYPGAGAHPAQKKTLRLNLCASGAAHCFSGGLVLLRLVAVLFREFHEGGEVEFAVSEHGEGIHEDEVFGLRDPEVRDLAVLELTDELLGGQTPRVRVEDDELFAVSGVSGSADGHEAFFRLEDVVDFLSLSLSSAFSLDNHFIVHRIPG